MNIETASSETVVTLPVAAPPPAFGAHIRSDFIQGMGKVGMPLRVAVTGLGQSPAIDAVMALVGKERVLARIDHALAYIEARMAAE